MSVELLPVPVFALLCAGRERWCKFLATYENENVDMFIVHINWSQFFL